MTRVARVLLLTLIALLPATALARKHELVDPAPVAVPAGMSVAAVATEIKRSLAGRTWVVASETPGHIDAVLHLRKHVARVAIDYDSQRVRFAYVSSENLDYKEKRGKRLIHGNYLSWIANVVADLSRNLQIAAELH